MSSIVWLASYPKSGNTWLRALLSNYLRDADTPADINSLGQDWFAHAGRRVTFDELVGVEASALEQPAIDRLRPEVYRRLAREAPRDLYVKVHDSWLLTDGENPVFPADATAGVIYIVRNPLDVAPSFANHLGVSVPKAVDRMCDESFAMSNSLERLGDQLRQLVGSWSGHVRSWLDRSGLPCHLVHYEDLHRDPERVLLEVVRFCGLPDEPRRVRKAIAFSDFAELRRQEQENGFRERLRVTPGGFFRRGVVGGWRDELPAGLVARLVQAHRETMHRFGYLDESTLAEVRLAAGISSRT